MSFIKEARDYKSFNDFWSGKFQTIHATEDAASQAEILATIAQHKLPTYNEGIHQLRTCSMTHKYS